MLLDPRSLLEGGQAVDVGVGSEGGGIKGTSSSSGLSPGPGWYP